MMRLDALTLRRIPDPILKEVSEMVNLEDFLHSDIMLDQMSRLMNDHGGIGLAANQIGEALRYFAIRRSSGDQLIINPTVLKTGGTYRNVQEGCLSLPGVSYQVGRWDSVTIEFTSPDVGKCVETFEGLEAQICEHEMDHLVGVCISQRSKMTGPWPSLSRPSKGKKGGRVTPKGTHPK